MNKVFGLVVVAVSLCIIQLSFGQTCCSGGVPLSNNVGLPVSDKGNWQFALNYDINVLKTLLAGSSKLNDQQRERRTQSYILEIGYSLTPKLAIDGFLSYIIQERNIFAFGNKNSSVTNGVGDAVLLLKYVFINKSNRAFQVGVGPKVPTGKTDITDEQGLRYNADLQPGSGAWDLIAWSNYNHQFDFRKSMAVATSFSLRLTGENPNYLGSLTYEFGDEFQIITTLSDRFVLGRWLLDPSVALRYRKAFHDKTNSEIISATGGEWLFVTPGISVVVLPQLSVNTALELPLYSFVNSTQLTPTYRITAGIFYRLIKNEKL